LPKDYAPVTVLAAVLIFGAGLVSGVGLTIVVAVHRLQYAIHHPEQAPSRVAHVLKRRLGLSAEQETQIEAIVAKRQAELTAIRQRFHPQIEEQLDELHKDHFRAVLHVVILADKLRGTVHDPCSLTQFDEEQASCHWDSHRKNFALGVDGWWPDEGDPLDIVSRLVRNRMYWEGPQLDRPNERPYALHRNGYAGMQRYASFLWSGDVYSTWETLKVHIPIAINTGLTGIPYWGTDIGGFVPTTRPVFLFRIVQLQSSNGTAGPLPRTFPFTLASFFVIFWWNSQHQQVHSRPVSSGSPPSLQSIVPENAMYT
jgi:hypothetical protein